MMIIIAYGIPNNGRLNSEVFSQIIQYTAKLPNTPLMLATYLDLA